MYVSMTFVSGAKIIYTYVHKSTFSPAMYIEHIELT